MSNPELYKLLAEEAAKVAAMTPEERSAYYDQIKAGQLAYIKANPYTEGERQARAMRPKPTLADALELPEIRALVDALKRDEAFYQMGLLDAPKGEYEKVATLRQSALAALQTKGGA